MRPGDDKEDLSTPEMGPAVFLPLLNCLEECTI